MACSLFTEMINATGHAPLFAIQIMSNAGMVGAATAVLLLTRDPMMKKIAKGAIPTSILAVGEPTIFGVNIPAGFAFITGSIGAGFGGMMVVLLGVSTNGVKPPGSPRCRSSPTVNIYSTSSHG